MAWSSKYFQNQSCSVRILAWWRCLNRFNYLFYESPIAIKLYNNYSTYLNVSLALGILILCKVFICLEPAVLVPIIGRYHPAVPCCVRRKASDDVAPSMSRCSNSYLVSTSDFCRIFHEPGEFCWFWLWNPNQDSGSQHDIQVWAKSSDYLVCTFVAEYLLIDDSLGRSEWHYNCIVFKLVHTCDKISSVNQTQQLIYVAHDIQQTSKTVAITLGLSALMMV